MLGYGGFLSLARFTIFWWPSKVAKLAPTTITMDLEKNHSGSLCVRGSYLGEISEVTIRFYRIISLAEYYSY